MQIQLARFRLHWLVTLMALTVSLTSCGGSSGSTDAGAATASAPASTPSTTRNLATFVTTLEQDRFVVQQGTLTYVDLLKAVSEGLLPSAYGNNAGAAYFTAVLPPAPNQDSNPQQAPPPGLEPANPPIYPPGGSFKLRANEAVVVITRTPPQATYFGYIGYLGLTENKPGKDYSNVHVTGSDFVGWYHRIFGSLGDTLDNRRIKTDGTPNGSAGNPFSSTTVIIFSADRTTNARVRRALEAAGYPDSITNDYVLPSNLAQMGLEKGKDTFIILGRAAIWQDEAVGSDYLAHVGDLSAVYRVTPGDQPVANPYPMPSTIPQDTGSSEVQVLPTLDADLETMRTHILATYGTPDYTVTELTTGLWIPYGFTGYNLDMDCLADNRDTFYLKTGTFKFQSDDDFAICYGVNHDMTGFTTYCNLSLYGSQYLNGVAGIYSPSFPNSANAYLPGPRSPSYYACRVGRTIGGNGEPCVIVPKSTGNPLGWAFGVDNGADVFLVYRGYVNPRTLVAPSVNEVSFDRAVVFTKK